MNELNELILLAKNNDHSAFEGIVRKFQDMAIGYAYSIVRDFDTAKDVVQEAFIQAYLDLDKLRDPAAFPGWLRSIVFKFCDRHTRGKILWAVSTDENIQLMDDRQNPHDIAERNEINDLINNEIDSLPEKEKEVTILYFINGYSQADIGNFLEIPVGTVKSRLHKARAQLKQRMEHMITDHFNNIKPGDNLTKRIRNILEGIENIEWRNGCICFCGAVASAMNYLKEDVSYN